jgi:hypothetical protein
MISRRSFLIGLGSFLTPPFVVRARRYALATGTPLPLDSDPGVHTLHAEIFEPEESSDGNKWRLSLGSPWEQDPPPPPTWRAYLATQGYRLESANDLEQACRETGAGSSAVHDRSRGKEGRQRSAGEALQTKGRQAPVCGDAGTRSGSGQGHESASRYRLRPGRSERSGEHQLWHECASKGRDGSAFGADRFANPSAR